jgi:hypothetical protein
MQNFGMLRFSVPPVFDAEAVKFLMAKQPQTVNIPAYAMQNAWYAKKRGGHFNGWTNQTDTGRIA